MMNYTQLVDFVEHRTGVDDAERALRGTLHLIGHYLPSMTTSAIARDLPECADLFSSREAIESDDLDRFVLRLASALDTESGKAYEVATAVGEGLAAALSSEALVHLRKDLPSFLADLVREREASAPADVKLAGGGHTLGDGRPGSHKPVSESDVAQQDSIARGGEKEGRLAASHGTEQERLKHTIADGKPGSSRPISE